MPMPDFVQILKFSGGFWFSLLILIAGIFTAYFGSGKSRLFGVALICLGGFVGFVCWLLWWQGYLTELLEQVLVVVGALIGAIAAMGIFMVAIMKM